MLCIIWRVLSHYKEGISHHFQNFSRNLNVHRQNKCCGMVSLKISLLGKMQRGRSPSFELFQLEMYVLLSLWCSGKGCYCQFRFLRPDGVINRLQVRTPLHGRVVRCLTVGQTYFNCLRIYVLSLILKLKYCQMWWKVAIKQNKKHECRFYAPAIEQKGSMK